MALVPDINTWLQEVPRAQRTVDVNDDDPVERYFDLARYYGDGSDDNQSRSESSILTPGLLTDTATSPSVISDSSTVDSPTEESPRVPGLHSLDGVHNEFPLHNLHNPAHPQLLPLPQHHVDHDQDHDYPHPHHHHTRPHRNHQQKHHTRKTLHIEDAQKEDSFLVWPQADPSQRPPRERVLQLPSSKKKSRRPSSPASRQVKNPAETAQIRKVGACIKCRIEKLKCSDGGVCHHCHSKYGEPLCERTCLRKTLTEIAKHTTPVRYTGLTYDAEQSVLRTKWVPDRVLMEVSLSFDGSDPQAPTLRTCFQQCRSLDDNSELVAFHRDRVPLHEQLVGWAERQIAYERATGRNAGFEGSIEAFVMAYARGGSSLPRIDLLRRIHQMNCMYRIWKMDGLFWRTAQSAQVYGLPPIIHAELRQIVRKALESAERDIFSELDKFLKPAGIPSKDRAPMWAGLWQLIFILKNLTRFFAEASYAHQGRSGRAMAAHHDFELLEAATEQLFVATLSFYGSHYRQASNLQVGLQCLDSYHIPSSRDRRHMDDAFKRTRLDRGSFHDAVQRSPDELDQLMKILVVDHEVKRLSRRRNRGRAQPQVLAVASSSDILDSDVEGDIEMMD